MSRRLRVLLTAFEPFDATGLNSSREGCLLFLEQHAALFDLRFAVLPVEYGRDTEAVDALLRDCSPDVLLHTGQAAGSAWLRVERYAVNLRYPGARERSAGRIPIDPKGADRLESTLPVEELARGLQGSGLPAAPSEGAGVYLCNHVLYRSLQRAARSPHPPPLVGFLHVPALPEQVSGDEACLSAGETARAIQTILAHLQAVLNPAARQPPLPVAPLDAAA